MKTLNKLLFGTALATALTFNSYSQTTKNTLVAYVSFQDEKKESVFNVDSIKPYGLSFSVEKISIMDLIMGKKLKDLKSEIKPKLYIVRKTEKEMIVVPAITDGGYNFSKDSEKEIEKQVREFIKEGKIRISDPVEYGSAEMFLELVGYEK